MSSREVNINVIGGQQQPLYTYKPVVLQSNMADDHNILPVDAFSIEKRKYIIRWDFDLDGQTLEVGTNCLIEFDGGSLSNGTVVMNDTIVMSSMLLNDVIHDVTLQGTYSFVGICDISKYMHEGAVLPLNKSYVSYGLPVESRTFVRFEEGMPRNNIVFVVSRGADDGNPSSFIVFTTTNNITEYAYREEYAWEDAPDYLKMLFGWIDLQAELMCDISLLNNDGDVLPRNKLYNYDGLPVESRYYVHVDNDTSVPTLVFAISRGNESSDDFPNPNSLVVFSIPDGSEDFEYKETVSWGEADDEYKKLYGWAEPKLITGEDLDDSVVDNEDICFNAERQLQFKDKEYNQSSHSGKGRKYLRANIQPLGIRFDGIVEGVATTYSGGTFLGIYYDIIADYFVAKMNNTGTVYYSVFADSPAAQGKGDYGNPDYYENPTEELIFLNKEDNSIWKWVDSTSKLVRQSAQPVMENILTQSMINQTNTIYHVQYDYHLNFNTITVPTGSVLVIDGGGFHHGTLNLNGCRVAPDYMSLAIQDSDVNDFVISGVPADGAIKTIATEGEAYITVNSEWVKIVPQAS